MDVRCKNCDKLFRVPDSKISGKGVKFACTRCGEYIQISKDEVEQELLAKTAASASSLSEPTPTPPLNAPTLDQDLPAQKPVGASQSAALEVRCDNCSKLFRVPREKISGKGIRFACTRCGEYVIVAQEAAPEPIEAPVAPKSSEPNSEYAGVEWKPKQQEPAVTEPVSAPEPPPSISTTQENPAVSSEERPLAFDLRPSLQETLSVAEPDFTSPAEPTSTRVSKVDLEFLPPQAKRTETFAPEEQTPDNFLSELAKAYAATTEAQDALPREEPLSFAEFPSSVGAERDGELQPSQESEATNPVPEALEPDFATAPEVTAEPQSEPSGEEESQPPLVQESEPSLSSLSQPSLTVQKVELVPRPESMREAFEASRTAPRPEPPVSEIVIQETAPAAVLETPKKAAPVSPFNWIDKVLLPIMALCIIVAAGYALFIYHQESVKKEMRAASELLTQEGLLITNVTNSMDTNGDLVITGTVQNTSDKQKADWYLVVVVYNAQRTEIDKLRLLKGKQLYSRRDYEILAKRGINVQELKAKNLEEQGMTIPAKSSVDFSIRYVQPPDSVTSLTPMLQTFDPVRLFKEITEDNK